MVLNMTIVSSFFPVQPLAELLSVPGLSRQQRSIGIIHGSALAQLEKQPTTRHEHPKCESCPGTATQGPGVRVYLHLFCGCEGSL